VRWTLLIFKCLGCSSSEKIGLTLSLRVKSLESTDEELRGLRGVQLKGLIRLEPVG
jgi:uncharacterized metal-binding protein